VFVDIGAERRALDVGVDLVGDRNEAMPDHFERDRIDGESGVGSVLHMAPPFFPPLLRRVKRFSAVAAQRRKNAKASSAAWSAGVPRPRKKGRNWRWPGT